VIQAASPVLSAISNLWRCFGSSGMAATIPRIAFCAKQRRIVLAREPAAV
jgi:hypothetical protein